MSKGNQRFGLQTRYHINEQIKSTEVLVITNDGNNLGIMPKTIAIRKALDAGLDLVQVGEKNSIPVTKIMDFGKFLYEKKKQLSDAKKQQKSLQLKEVKMRPNIGDQDYLVKIKRSIKFFNEGKKVKFTLQFKGREITKVNVLGPDFFRRINDSLKDAGIDSLVEEKEQRSGPYWSKVYFVKNNK